MYAGIFTRHVFVTWCLEAKTWILIWISNAKVAVWMQPMCVGPIRIDSDWSQSRFNLVWACAVWTGLKFKKNSYICMQTMGSQMSQKVTFIIRSPTCISDSYLLYRTVSYLKNMRCLVKMAFWLVWRPIVRACNFWKGHTGRNRWGVLNIACDLTRVHARSWTHAYVPVHFFRPA